MEETLPDKPRSADEVPILLLAFLFVCGHHVVDRWVVQHGLREDCVGEYADEFVVLVDTEDVIEESVVFRCGLTPCVSDVLDLAPKSICVGLECFVVDLGWPTMCSCD